METKTVYVAAHNVQRAVNSINEYERGGWAVLDMTPYIVDGYTSGYVVVLIRAES